MKRKIRVALLFGGRSTEHDVSLTSAAGIARAIDAERFEVVPILITQQGQWLSLGSLERLQNAPNHLLHDDWFLPEAKRPALLGDSHTRGLIYLDNPASSSAGSLEQTTTRLEREGPVYQPVDVIFPMLHGRYGEDGTVQGLAALADLPCVGAGVLGSAMGMDKVAMKMAFAHQGLAIVDYLHFLRSAWVTNAEPIRREIRERLGFPCFIKPANSGSSVGVTKVHDEGELEGGVATAAAHDRKIIAEKAVDARELECAVLGNDHPQASVVGEVIPCHEFYDYEAKYLAEGNQIIIPAEISSHLACCIQGMAVQAFQAIDGAGFARIDFFLDRHTEAVYVNEINTIPGFTPISMFPMLWQASGLSYAQLISRLIDLALERFAQEKGEIS